MSSAEFDSQAVVEKKEFAPLEKKFRVVMMLLIVFELIAACEGFYSRSLTNRVQALEGEMQAQISNEDESIQRVQDQLGMHDKNFADMQGDLSKAQTALSSTQGELRKARETTDQLVKQQKDSSE